MSDTPDTLVDAPEAFGEVPYFPPVDTSRAECQFNPFDWYWHLQDGSIFNSRRYWLRLSVEDEGYQAFMAAGNPRTPMPKDAAGNDSLDALQDQVLSHYGLFASLAYFAASVRYRYETAGITVNGMAVSTDRQSQSLITGASVLAARKPDTVVRFKGANGFVSLNAEAIQVLAEAVGAHVQTWFAKEDAVDAAISDGTIATPAAVEAAFAA